MADIGQVLDAVGSFFSPTGDAVDRAIRGAAPFGGFPFGGGSLITRNSPLGRRILEGEEPAETEVTEALSAGNSIMVHRDPETGQFRAGEPGSSELSYPDFNFQNIVKDIEGTLGGSTASTAQRDEFVAAGPGGIDHNEVAELVTMFRHHAVEFKPGGTDAGVSPGSWNSSNSLGVNIEDEEDITSDDIIRSTGVTFHQTDRGAQLDMSYLAGTTPGFDTGTGLGFGSSGAQHTAHFMNFRHHYGQGPVVDADDDLSIRLDVEKDNAGANTTVEARVYYKLGWRIHQLEGRRRHLGF